jgi:hypothetical protein
LREPSQYLIRIQRSFTLQEPVQQILVHFRSERDQHGDRLHPIVGYTPMSVPDHAVSEHYLFGDHMKVERTYSDHHHGIGKTSARDFNEEIVTRPVSVRPLKSEGTECPGLRPVGTAGFEPATP